MVRGAAVVHHNAVYCISDESYTVHCYQPDEDKWQAHSQCPYCDTGLAIIDGLLTAVGGRDTFQQTNTLVSWRRQEWVEEFPSMNTARSGHAVVSDGDYIIAIGGDHETSVELFAISSKTWSTVASLPRPLNWITATLCGDDVYTMDCSGKAYSISLYSLISSQRMSASADPSPELTWLPLPYDVPVCGSTLSSICRQVVAVGGLREDATATSSIHQLFNGKWVDIGCMDTARYDAIVAVLPEDRVVVVGGGDHLSVASSLTSVELAVVC